MVRSDDPSLRRWKRKFDSSSVKNEYDEWEQLKRLIKVLRGGLND